jgi:glycosyltransferase involved in cell wall biosynthesis
MDYPPESTNKDITQRYRRGYEYLRGRGLDVIAFWEDDDWYAPNYLETMIKSWENAGKPELFSTSYTIYYNIRIFSYFEMGHPRRTCAMSTLIRPDMSFNWPPDHEPYLDTHLSDIAKHADGKRLKLVNFAPKQHICLGIKHGIGLTGGDMHTSRLERYDIHGGPDKDLQLLRRICDPESFEFYVNYFNKPVAL